ncbi:hypothetical protein HUJ04_012803 [Dendroctonus ponderosae]|nr:hypothetical protein HUJ04_012803 [Dendroctonus ponderosae]
MHLMEWVNALCATTDRMVVVYSTSQKSLLYMYARVQASSSTSRELNGPVLPTLGLLYPGLKLYMLHQMSNRSGPFSPLHHNRNGILECNNEQIQCILISHKASFNAVGMKSGRVCILKTMIRKKTIETVSNRR